MIEKKTQTGRIKHKSGLLAIIGLIIAMIFWASSFIAMKSAFRFYDPFFVIFGRMAVASAGFLFFIRQIKRVRIKKSDLKFILLMGFCEPCLYFAKIYIGFPVRHDYIHASTYGCFCSMAFSW